MVIFRPDTYASAGVSTRCKLLSRRILNFVMQSTPNLSTCRRVPLTCRAAAALPTLVVLFLLLVPGSCGFGSAAVASTIASGSSNAGPVVGDLSVVDPSDPSARAATSPAEVRFRLTGEGGSSSSVSIDYSKDGGASFSPITTSTNMTGLAPGDYPVDWNYVVDLGDEAFRSDVQLRATVDGGNSVVVPQISIGNDAPTIVPAAFTLPDPFPEPEGNVQVGFEVSDSAGDQVDIRIEFNLDAANGFPDESWQLARSVGVDAGSDTPSFALNNLDPPADGQPLSADFFWESAFDPAGNPLVSAQMASLESDVRLRFKAVDAFGAHSEWEPTNVFRIDNNRRPQLILNEVAFLLGAKDRGNIPIPLKIYDDESDEVQVAIQWKAAGDVFPKARNMAGQEVDLATLNAEETRDLLENPHREQDRRDAQIAREAPPSFQGRLGTLYGGLLANEVQLPEVASSQAGLLALGIEGRTLEILRGAQPETVQWSANSLNAPVDAHIVGQGVTALVLDQVSASGDWQVRELDLATGDVGPTLATGGGDPKCMDVDPAGRTLYVGSSTDIFRFDLFTGQPLGNPLSHSFSGSLRCLAALGDQVALASGDVINSVGELWRFDFSSGSQNPSAVLLSGLASQRGRGV